MHITLDDGNTTHYELSGPEGAPLVVLVHGISIPSYCWDSIAPQLAQAGFRVLRYDVYGRGESSYPGGPYDRNLLVRQLAGVLDKLCAADEKVNMVGFSFGGAMAALFTSLYAPHVRRLALVAPFGGVPQADPRKPLRTPLVGELLMRFKLKPALLARGIRLLGAAGLPATLAQKFERQLARSDFLGAYLSLMRTNALDSYGPAYAAVAASGVPTALAWGTADEDIPVASIAQTREQLKPWHTLEVPGASHGAMLNDTSGVVPFLLAFLNTPVPETVVLEPVVDERAPRRRDGD